MGILLWVISQAFDLKENPEAGDDEGMDPRHAEDEMNEFFRGT